MISKGARDIETDMISKDASDIDASPHVVVDTKLFEPPPPLFDTAKIM